MRAGSVLASTLQHGLVCHATDFFYGWILAPYNSISEPRNTGARILQRCFLLSCDAFTRRDRVDLEMDPTAQRRPQCLTGRDGV